MTNAIQVITFDNIADYIVKDGPVTGLGGSQIVFKFDNGFGASVVSHPHSYGGTEGLFELAVIKWSKKDYTNEHVNIKDLDHWVIVYDTGITEDVIGHLEENAVLALLKEIQVLENPTKLLE